MRDIWWRGLLLASLLVLVVATGCGGGSTAPTGKGDGGGGGDATEDVAQGDLKTYQAAELPSVEEKLPPADQGRVVITLPAGWKTLQRNPKFLVASVPEENSATKLPRITVSVAEAPAELTSDTTAENADEQAAALQAQMTKDRKKWIEKCKPLGLADNVWIRHVRSAKLNDDYTAIQSLQIVRGGRLYSVELTVNAKENRKSSKPPIVYEKELTEYRKFGYTVAAHMIFPKSNEAVPAATEPAPAEPAPAAAEKKAEPAKPE